MKVQLSTISNGLRVITCEMPNTISASCKILVGTGGRHEKSFEPGISHFLEHMGFKGTTTRNALDITKEIEMLGGYSNAYTSNEATAYYANGLSSSIPKFMEIIGDIMSNSVFDEKEIRMESSVILQEIAMYNDMVDNLAYEALFAAAYKGHPMALPILGTSEFVTNITRENILRYVGEHYFARNMVLTVAGNIKHDEIVAQAEKHFSNIPSSGTRDVAGKAHFVENESIISADFDQMSLFVGFASPTDTADTNSKIAYDLASTALGGGSCSPLFQEIREKRGLVYSTYSHHNELTDGNSLLLSAGFTPANFEQIVACFADITRNANDFVSDDDITRAKNVNLVKLSSLIEKPDSISSHLGYMVLEEKAIELPQDSINRVLNFDTSIVREILGNLKNDIIAVGAAGPVPMPVLNEFKNMLK